MGGGGVPGFSSDEGDNDDGAVREDRKKLMTESFFELKDLRLFFGDLVHNPDDYDFHDLSEASLIQQLLDRCKMTRPDDYEAYKANLDKLMLTKMTEQLGKYADEDYPLKLSRIQA